MLHRNYVRPELNKVLFIVSKKVDKKYSGVKLTYLDANFPFYNGFPLLPHLSHNDGKKIDLSFVYENKAENVVNEKPSRSDYGVFVQPRKQDENTSERCLSEGHWQYDMAKYLTLGGQHKKLGLSRDVTKFLVREILNQSTIQKFLLNPTSKRGLN